MHITIDSASQFRDQFHRAGRNDQFSYEALGLLFDYFEDCAPDMELDVIAICCEYSEETPEEIANNYSIEMSAIEEGDTAAEREQVLGFLNDNTSVVGVTSTGAIVYAQF